MDERPTLKKVYTDGFKELYSKYHFSALLRVVIVCVVLMGTVLSGVWCVTSAMNGAWLASVIYGLVLFGGFLPIIYGFSVNSDPIEEVVDY
jgi:hypothetical protein